AAEAGAPARGQQRERSVEQRGGAEHERHHLLQRPEREAPYEVHALGPDAEHEEARPHLVEVRAAARLVEAPQRHHQTTSMTMRELPWVGSSDCASMSTSLPSGSSSPRAFRISSMFTPCSCSSALASLGRKRVAKRARAMGTLMRTLAFSPPSSSGLTASMEMRSRRAWPAGRGGAGGSMARPGVPGPSALRRLAAASAASMSRMRRRSSFSAMVDLQLEVPGGEVDVERGGAPAGGALEAGAEPAARGPDALDRAVGVADRDVGLHRHARAAREAHVHV